MCLIVILLLFVLFFVFGILMIVYVVLLLLLIVVLVEGILLNILVNVEVICVLDVVILFVGVVIQVVDGNSVMCQNVQQMDKVLVVIKVVGIVECDVQISGVSFNLQYCYVDNEVLKIIGYQVSNMVSLKVCDIVKFGKVLDVLVVQGVNQINGFSFEIDQFELVYDEVCLVVLKKVQVCVQIYVRLLGLQVCCIVSIFENSNGGFCLMLMMCIMVVGVVMDKVILVVLGELIVLVNLDVVFELGC